MPSFAPYFGCETADSIAAKLEQLEKMKEGSVVLKPDLGATAVIEQTVCKQTQEKISPQPGAGAVRDTERCRRRQTPVRTRQNCTNPPSGGYGS